MTSPSAASLVCSSPTTSLLIVIHVGSLLVKLLASFVLFIEIFNLDDLVGLRIGFRVIFFMADVRLLGTKLIIHCVAVHLLFAKHVFLRRLLFFIGRIIKVSVKWVLLPFVFPLARRLNSCLLARFLLIQRLFALLIFCQ